MRAEIAGIRETMATKAEIADMRAGMATKANIAELAAMISRGFEGMQEQLDVRDQVERHEREIQNIRRTLNIG